jgi:cyclic pyranopterin phosphate synthase
VRISIDKARPGLQVEAEVRTNAQTGVEMEALTAVAVACLALFDMLKAVDRSMVIGGIEVIAKSGGKSGRWG